MALKEYKPGTTFPGCMARTIGESEPVWPAPVRAKERAPNVLFIESCRRPRWMSWFKNYERTDLAVSFEDGATSSAGHQ